MVNLLQSAGLAVKALTQSQSKTEEGDVDGGDFGKRKESFTAAASQYFDTLLSIDINLRRQINALEEADILPKESATKESQGSMAVPTSVPGTGIALNAASARQASARKGAITGGGLGNLDVGWLNCRNDNVGKEMEAELWEQAQRFVEKLEKKNAAAADGFPAGNGSQDVYGQANTQNNMEEMDQI